ncbi:hypothetical protein QQS21_010076 [Conoideocrella luteorostrata]|uniref:C3H1-type domain-containing protein n=1 Tax=Conoideocrella luteorostrata TaxID=1105319 RepID=A0AAJ0CFX0_9HYPO|nr:hypothetical protein QQS21_010076 [Conoideocrella luteorostrata]
MNISRGNESGAGFGQIPLRPRLQTSVLSITRRKLQRVCFHQPCLATVTARLLRHRRVQATGLRALHIPIKGKVGEVEAHRGLEDAAASIPALETITLLQLIMNMPVNHIRPIMLHMGVLILRQVVIQLIRRNGLLTMEVMHRMLLNLMPLRRFLLPIIIPTMLLHRTHRLLSTPSHHHMALHSPMGSLIKAIRLRTHPIGLLLALHSPHTTREVVDEEDIVIVEVLNHLIREGLGDMHTNMSQYRLQRHMASPIHMTLHSRRGRGGGGGHRDGARGRGGHHSNSNQHHGKNRPNSHNKSNQNDNKPKAEPPSVGKKKKRKVNTLGLTPGVESESEDDEGEEKALTELIGAETLQISDVATFLAERRKNYPTKARVEAKKAAQKSLDKTAELEKQADKLRKQLAKVESSIKRKREQGDEGDEMRGPAENSSGDEKPEVMSSRSKAAPPPPSAKKADVSRHCKYYSTGGTCGKKGKCRFVHDPEVREAAIKEREANHGRLTIQQRLILNDKEQEDLTVLQSIQYIRQKNLMESESSKAEDGEEAQPMNKEKDKDENDAQNIVTPALATSGSSLLPVAPASLPAPPPKKETSIPSHSNPPPSVGPAAESTSDGDAKQCEGWLLQPYGNSNGESSKADDLP